MSDTPKPLPPVHGHDPLDKEEEVGAGNGTAENDESVVSVIKQLRERRKELQPFGKTETLEVPGYEGLLGVEYNFIDTDVTEALGKKVARETRAVHGKGAALLGSMDTLIAACKQIVIRDDAKQEWRPMDKQRPVKFDRRLAEKLDYEADDEREAVLGVFGSEHAVIQQNVQLSRWLGDVTRDSDEDFLGLL